MIIRSLRPDDPKEIRDLFELYDEAIPPSERKSRETIRSMLESANYSVLGAYSEQGLIGFIVGLACQQQAVTLLEYMGVRRAWQGQGIGSRLFLDLLAVTRNSDVLLLEVDSDQFPSADHSQRVARKRFYQRLGCREISGLTYRLPLPGDPPQMNLLVYWSGRKSVERGTLKHWLTALYVEVYGQPESDPRIEAMMAGLPDQVPLV